MLTSLSNKQARSSSANSRVKFNCNVADEQGDQLLLTRRAKNRTTNSDYYSDLSLDIQTSNHLQTLARSPMTSISKPVYLTQALNPTITDSERIIGYTDEQLDHFMTNNEQTMNLFSSVTQLLEENKTICESTLKAKNNVVMQMIPYLFGMNRHTSKVVNSLKMSADQHNDGLFLSMNPDQNLHRYLYMGQVRQAILDIMIVEQPDTYISPIETKGQLINTVSARSSCIMNFDSSFVQGDKHLLSEPMTYKQRTTQPFEHNMFFSSPWGQHFTDMTQNYTAFTVIMKNSNDLFLNPSGFSNMLDTENAKQQSVHFISNGHMKEETPELDLSEATLQTIRFGALMLNTIQDEEFPKETKKWWVERISVADVVNNLECDNFSISAKLNAGNNSFTMTKQDLSTIVQNIVDKWCEASVGYIITKDDLSLFKQNPACSHIFKMLQISKTSNIIKLKMNITGKNITEEDEKEFTENILPNLSQTEWKSLVEMYLKCWYIPITKLLVQGRLLRTMLTNVYVNQIKGDLPGENISVRTSFTFFYPTDMNYSTKVYALLGSYVRDKDTNDWTMLPGTVFDFNLAQNRDVNPEEIEPDLSTLKTVDTNSWTPEDMLDRLFIHDYTQAENKNTLSKYVGLEFENNTSRRCVKVNPSCIKTDRDALITPEFIKKFEAGADSSVRLDDKAAFTNTLQDEHSPYGNDLSILIKGRYAGTIMRMLGYAKNEEAVLNFFNSKPELKLLMGYISTICFAPRNKARVVMTQNKDDKNVPASEEPKTFMYMRFFMLNQLMNLAASFTRNKSIKPGFLLDQLLPFTLKETPNYQPNQPLWVDKLENLYGEKININCNALTVGRYVDFFEEAVNLFANLDASKKVSMTEQDKQALAGYITIANHYLFSVTSLDLAGGNTEIKTEKVKRQESLKYSYVFNPVVVHQLTEQQESVRDECPQIQYFQNYRAVTPSGSKHVNVLSGFDTDPVFTWLQKQGVRINETYCKHLKTVSAYNALTNLNAVSNTTANLQFKTFDEFMPVRYRDLSKDLTVAEMLTKDMDKLNQQKYSILDHILNLAKCTELFRVVHTSSINALKLIESCAMGITGAIPVYYVDSNKIVRNLTQAECTKLYQYLQDSKTISDHLVNMGKKIFGTPNKYNKWLVNHVQPFEIKESLPIINCVFSDKFIPYINKQYCLTDDFYNQLQGRKILTSKGWEVDPTCTSRKDLMNKILNTSNAPNDIGIIDVNKKTFFSFCSSQIMARAYQFTIFQLIKKSLASLNYATDAIFDSQSNSRTLRILNNVNNKLDLLKSDKIKRFNLLNQLHEQYDLVVLPFQEVIEINLTSDKFYISNQQSEVIAEEEPEQICEDVTMEDNQSSHLQLDSDIVIVSEDISKTSTPVKSAVKPSTPAKPEKTPAKPEKTPSKAVIVQSVTENAKKSKKKNIQA